MTHEGSTDVAIVVLRVPGSIGVSVAERLRAALGRAFKGTPLAGVQTLVLSDGAELEIIRTRVRGAV